MGRGRDYLGTYRLIRLIRAGQTCQVWEATDDVKGGRFALKALQPDYRKDREEIAYLRHEFEVAKDFDHEQVIHIHAFQTDRQVPFLVMELGEGRNMKLVIRDRHADMMPMMPEIIRQSALGLKYVHEQGWIHRDVKPDNFLLSDAGNVKLVDFAIAQKQRSALGRLFSLRSKVQGTRSYMSPEQIRGASLDQRSDIYSFGCALFELLAGKLPYTGNTPEDLLTKHLRAGVPSILSINSNITNNFSDLLIRMMDKSPDRRPQSLSDFLNELNAIRIFRTLPRAPSKK